MEIRILILASAKGHSWGLIKDIRLQRQNRGGSGHPHRCRDQITRIL